MISARKRLTESRRCSGMARPTALPQLSRYLYLTDGIRDNGSQVLISVNTYPVKAGATPETGVHFRHGGRANILHLDFHLSSAKK